MIVNKHFYFIFTLLLLLFLLNFIKFHQNSPIYAVDDGFFSVVPEDYFSFNDDDQDSSLTEQSQENNQYNQQSAASNKDKYGKLKNSLSEENYSKDFNFIAAGDWNCNKETEKTINKMTKLEPELILGLGDYTFENISPQCWFDISEPINDKIKIAIGNHDLDSQSSYHQLLDHYNLQEPYYSFNFHNIHFLAISSEHPFEQGSKQYEFIKNDLEESLQDQSILWRIVFMHKPMYTSATFDEEDSEELRDTFHELFETSKIDLVLSGHTQYYQRSLPISYNTDNPIYPVIMDQNNNQYSNNHGIIFVTAGTAGDDLHDIAYSLSYYVIQQGQFGFLNFDLTNNGQTIVSTFYDTDDTNILDRFVISKDNSGKKKFSEDNSEQYDNNNYYFTSQDEKVGISNRNNNQLS
jgi:Calcineurin-like phosphoesterase